jgi:hypothetical protein
MMLHIGYPPSAADGDCRPSSTSDTMICTAAIARTDGDEVSAHMTRYTYVAAWAVGGISLPSVSGPIDLSRSGNPRFLLTRDPDELLVEIERGGAVANVLLNLVLGHSEHADFGDAVALAMDNIRTARQKKAGEQAALVVEAHGEVAATIDKERLAERDGFVVAFDAVDKQTIRQAHRRDVEAMRLALALESEPPLRFTPLIDDIYLTDEQGRTLYSLTFSVTGEATVSRGLAPDGPSRISARYVRLARMESLERVQRLFSEMADSEADRLRAFLTGWAALEVFINKTFKTYEDRFLAPLTAAEQPVLRERFLVRVKEVMKDKYRLTDKFLAVAAVLFPDAPDATLSGDFENFRQVKGSRDAIYHGEQFCDGELPVHELSGLLRRYLLAYLESPSQGSDADIPTLPRDAG